MAFLLTSRCGVFDNTGSYWLLFTKIPPENEQVSVVRFLRRPKFGHIFSTDRVTWRLLKVAGNGKLPNLTKFDKERQI